MKFCYFVYFFEFCDSHENELSRILIAPLIFTLSFTKNHNHQINLIHLPWACRPGKSNKIVLSGFVTMLGSTTITFMQKLFLRNLPTHPHDPLNKPILQLIKISINAGTKAKTNVKKISKISNVFSSQLNKVIQKEFNRIMENEVFCVVHRKIIWGTRWGRERSARWDLHTVLWINTFRCLIILNFYLISFLFRFC